MTVQRFAPGLSVRKSLWTRTAARLGSLKPVVRLPQFGAVLDFVAFAIVYFVAFRLATSFGVGSYSPLWLPSSVLLCALLKSRTEHWWLFILSIVPLRLLGQSVPDFPLWLSVANTAIDIGKALGAAIALRHFMRNPLRFDTLRDFAIFALFAVLLVPALAAIAGASVRAALGDEFWSAWVRWFISDALTQLVATPPILYWIFAAHPISRPLDVRPLIEPVLLASGLALAGYWCMAGGSTTSFAEPRFYVVFPLMFWAALRFGMAGVSGAVAITSAFIVMCALQRDGPFSSMSPSEAASALQNFLFVRSAPLYVIAALMERRNAGERALRESEGRFRALADSAPMLLWITGPDKQCTFVNQGWLTFTGRTLDQDLGHGWMENVHPDDRQHCQETWDAAFAARRPVEIEYRLRRHDGEYRWVLDKGAPRFAENGEFLGHIGSVLDITERKAYEDAERARAHVHRLAIMGELTAAVAHELRQPSAAIMSNAEAALALLEAGAMPHDEMRDIVTDIKNATLRANVVLGRIQDFLRNREVEMEVIDLNTVVSEVLPLISVDARMRRMKIYTELGEGLPLVLGSRTQLQQVLINLIVNGMDAMSNTPDGKRQVLIRTSKPNGDARVEVAVFDSGSGIASGNMSRVFESFFTTRAEGMGLGLSVARSIVESHGGRIWADNNPEGGATFRFTVRAATGIEATSSR